MIVLDTNVVSELMRTDPAGHVVRWIEGRPPTSLCTTAITQAEIFLGVQLLPKGKRREALEETANEIFDDDFQGRVFSFDGDAARAYARIVAARRRSGRPISEADAQIAAIARALGFDLATRNVSDFEGCGVELHDPWSG
jgi:predicted nucleic acid-binding protein